MPRALHAALAACWAACAAGAPAASPTEVSALDGSVTVTVDATAAALSEVSVKGQGGTRVPFGVSAEASLQGARILTQSVSAGEGGAVVVSRVLCLPGTDLPCAPQKATLNLTVAPAPTSVRVTLTVEGAMDPGTAPWTAPIGVDWAFADAGALKMWAPWDRGSKDALLPSDGGFSWWDGIYAMGTRLGTDDFVVAEHFATVNAGDNAALSVVGDPSNAPVPAGWLLLGGRGGADCATPTSCPGPASANFSYAMLRLAPGVVHTRSFDLVGTPASCYRPGLAWSLRAYPDFWLPVHGGASRIVDGLGSYSSYLGKLADPVWKKLGYQTSWDLSGRFFPYMGQFLPPMPSSRAQWENDAEGTQTRANCSYSSIDAYYGQMQSEGFSTLSYFNVFEYGINVKYSPDRGPPPPTTINEAHWDNASRYMADNFRHALVTNYACAWGNPCRSARWAPVEGKAQGSWQGSVVVDPREGLGYDASLLSQMRRKGAVLPHFAGVVVDRSDWNQLVNLDGDDGVTLVGNRTGWSMQHSYLQILAKLRVELDAAAKPGGDPMVMLDNSVGYAWLPFMKPFDGTYSEGGNVNAVGILGMQSTTILWTSNKNECCKTPEAADAYFQDRIRMGVFPQVPFPMNDHCIQPDPDATADYLRYGALFNAIKNTTWSLDPSPVSVSPPPLKANAFVGPKGELLYPLVHGNGTAASVTVANLPAAVGGLEADALHPGGTTAWQPVALRAAPRGAATATVPLVSGCALLRVRVKQQ